MTLHLSFSASDEARLRERAAAAGKDPQAFAMQLIQEHLAGSGEASETGEAHELPPDLWIARLRRWVASHRPLPSEADDSRERIYEGRGE